jgi:hypothetical protein
MKKRARNFNIGGDRGEKRGKGENTYLGVWNGWAKFWKWRNDAEQILSN